MYICISATVLAPQPITVFQKKQGRKTIDVYWLSDDGGLIILKSLASPIILGTTFLLYFTHKTHGGIEIWL